MDWSSMTRRLFLSITGGLLAKIGFAHAAFEADVQTLSAVEILERMGKTYAKCKTYQDLGCVTTVFIREDGQHICKKPFSTAFVRPGRFRYEFRSSFYGGTCRRYIVWADGTDVRTWWDIRPGVAQRSSLSSGLARATGVSGGSAHTVPALLLPHDIGGARLTHLTQLKRLENAKLGEIECFRIRGKFHLDFDPAEWERLRREALKVTGKDLMIPERSPETLWIEQSTFLLRRIERRKQFESFRTESTTTYEPVIDLPIVDNELQFNPPTNEI